MNAASLVGVEDIRRARAVLADRVHRTPLAPSETLGRLCGCRLFLKQELFQKTGAFKIRGALNRVALLTPDQRRRGVCTVSAGNHAQGVALAARLSSAPCAVVMPSFASRSKIDATRGYGAEVILHGDFSQIFERARQVEKERGMVFIPPFDDPAIIAGQGTVGLELMEDLPDVDVVVVPIGGGGLASGVAAAVKGLSPRTRVIGVEPFGADSMWRSLQSGKPERLEKIDTIADGLSAPFAGELTLAHIRAFCEDVVRITDAQMVEAMRLLLTRCKLLAEPAGAAAVAAVLSGKVEGLKDTDRVAAVVSGGNIDLDRLCALLASPPT